MKAVLFVAATAAIGALHGSSEGSAATGTDRSIAASTTVAPFTAPAAKGRLPGFAADLSDVPLIEGPDGWTILPDDKAWAAIAESTAATRQGARWAYARSLLGLGRGPDALGVLEVMGQDDPDLRLVGAFRLARGAALAQMNRPTEALAELVAPSLAGNPEACLWRLLALSEDGLDQALTQLRCALPALNARPLPARAPFLRAAARAAIAAGKPELAIRWMGQIPKTNAAANLLRGSAYHALGQHGRAQALFIRAGGTGTAEQRIDAELSGIEAASRQGTMAPEIAIRKLDRIRYVWRGGGIENRALSLSFRLAGEAGDLRGSLSAGAVLFNYFDLGPGTAALVSQLQGQLAAALDPSNGLPLDQAVALYWDFRDLAPMGAEGDYLVSRLGGRLQAAGLYARAAELFEHQLFARARDLAQGPLSVKVATLHILAGRPDRALATIRRTGSNNYPSGMLWERHRVEAVALAQVGKTAEALAVLEDVPNGDALGREILWKKRDWSALAQASAPSLPNGLAMSDVNQAVVLRYAIALAMLGREAEIAALRRRYGPAFAGLPSAAAFDALTSAPGSVDPEAVIEAIGAIPSASPAGEIADLLDLGSGSTAAG